MARKEYVDILEQGVGVWNAWREKHPEKEIDLSYANLSYANLSYANLKGAILNNAYLRYADLSRAHLSGADLKEAHLSEADLREADLRGAYLSGAYLNNAYLSGADLREAHLSEADLREADLREADLSGADLNNAYLNNAYLNNANLSETYLTLTDLSRAYLSEADLSRAQAGQTIFGDLDLRTVKGLETINHHGPSTIGTNTLERSEGDIPEVFLREAGLSETLLTYARSLFQSPIQYYTCFISYSSKDQKFAERLHADLRLKGIKCWFAPEDLKIGEEFPERIEEAIRFYDKLLIILSQNSINSSWVKKEVRAAQEKEEHARKKQSDTTVLFPLKIDASIENCQLQWVADLRRERHIGDFTRWKYHNLYEKAFQRLLRDLQPDQQ